MEERDLILNKLASALGRRDEQPNVDLAEEIVSQENKNAVAVLIEGLSNQKKEIRRDCIKTVYEIGKQKSGWISPYLHTFLDLLEAKDNRMQWGAMMAIDPIAKTDPEKVYPHLPVILNAAEKGSVITRDHAVKILVHIGRSGKHHEEIFQVLHEVLLKAPVNQFATYVEETLPLIAEENKDRFIATIELRMDEMNTEAKKIRLLKVITKLT